MGYTHSWRTENLTDNDKANYKKTVPILKQIVARYANILAFDYDEPERPPVVSEDMIRFNGKGENGHETFLFEPAFLRDFNFCKTAEKPYDIAVCECLLALKAFMPSMEISSDGFSGYLKDPKLDGSWNEAIENVLRLYGIHFKSFISKERSPYCDFGLKFKGFDEPENPKNEMHDLEEKKKRKLGAKQTLAVLLGMLSAEWDNIPESIQKELKPFIDKP